MKLEVEGIDVYYGDSHVLQEVSLSVAEGEAVALLGRNGAGKTTTMRAIMGLTPPRRGRILLDGKPMTGRQAHELSRAGVAYVPSGRRAFGSLTVRQNLELARRDSRRRRSGWTVDRVLQLFPQLQVLLARRAEFLSGGEQQMLKLGRALLSNPSILLLDEPTEGLAPVVVQEMGHWLESLLREDLGLLLAEQNALFALRLANRGYILEKGRIRQEAPASGLLGSEESLSYLGVARR